MGLSTMAFTWASVNFPMVAVIRKTPVASLFSFYETNENVNVLCAFV